MPELIAQRYRILAELGRGAMGMVYRVADTLQGDREFALKLIHVEGGISAAHRLRFKEEFRAMTRLKHPNTLDVYDFGQLDSETHYLTMEIVPGDDLSLLLQRGSLPLALVYDVLRQLLQALAFIHARHFVHRDIKADNIRLTHDGKLKLMDFGLMDQLGLPSNGKLSGTIATLPPEVARGGLINASSDLYSVGCLTYELLTGRPPFDGSLAEVVQAHLHRSPSPPETLRSDIPAPFSALVMRLLEKDQLRRYQTAGAVLVDLAEVAGLSLDQEDLDEQKSYLNSSVLVGREAEVAQLEQALTELREGRGGGILLGAPAGIGKTRLIRETLIQAKLEGITVLHGQCLESGMAAYEPLSQALRDLLPLSTSAELAQFGPVLSRILPGLQDMEPPVALDANLERIRLHDTVLAWLKAVSARTPLLFCLDDLHWSDSGSLEVLNACLRESDTQRFLCLATFRNDEVNASSPIWFTVDEGRTRYLKLEAFDMPRARALLTAMLHEMSLSPEFARFLFEATAGNAFFLTETVRYLLEEGYLKRHGGRWYFPADGSGIDLPGTVEATILRRVGNLSVAARSLAQVAAVIGRHQDLEMLLDVSGLEEEELFTQLDELIERQLIHRDEQGYSFPHDRLREALYADMPSELRCDLHQRCAEYLEPRRTPSLTNELAYHFSHGRDRKKAFEYLRQAGYEARRQGAIARAVENWKQADTILDSLDYPDKETHQADLWWTIGSATFEFWPAVAIDALERLVGILEAQGSIDRICAALKHVGKLLALLPGSVRERVLQRLTRPVPYHHRPRRGLWRLLPLQIASWAPRLIEAYGILGASYGPAGQPARGLAMIERAHSLLPFQSSSREGALLVAKCACLLPAGQFDAVVQNASQARDFLLEKDLAGEIEAIHAARLGSLGYHNVIAFQGLRPDPDFAERATGFAEALHAFNLLNLGWTFQGIWYAWSGRQREAREILEKQRNNTQKIGAPPYNWALYLQPYLAWQRGDLHEAKSLVDHALRYPHLDREMFAWQFILLLKGQIHLSLGEVDEAAVLFGKAEESSRAGQLSLVLIQALIGCGQVAIAKAQLDSARPPLQEALKMSQSGPARNPLHEAIASRHLSTLALLDGRLDEAHRLIENALAILTHPTLDNLFEQGILLLARSECHLRSNAAKEALHDLMEARELFQQLDNPYWLRLVRERLASLCEPEVAEHTAVKAAPVSPLPRESMAELLAACAQRLGCDELALYLNLDQPQRLAQHGQARTPLNPEMLTRLQESRKGFCAIDLSGGIGEGSNLGADLPSIALVPIGDRGLLFAVRLNLEIPLQDADLGILQEAAQLLQGMLEMPTPFQEAR